MAEHYMFGVSTDGEEGLQTTESFTLLPPQDDTQTPLLWLTWDLVYRLLTVYIDPCVVIFGIIGNALSFIVLFPKAKICSTFNYLCALAVVDSVYLLITGLYWFLATAYQIDLVIIVDCNVIKFISFAMSHMSVWLMVATSVERIIVVWVPLKAKINVSVIKSRLVVVFLIVLIAALNWQYLGAMEATPEGKMTRDVTSCQGKTPWITRYVTDIYPWIDSTLYSFLPATLITVFNGATVVHLYRNRNIEENASQAQSSVSRRVTVLSLLLTTTFVVLTTPIAVATVIYRSLTLETPTDTRMRVLIATHLLNTLSFFNHAINFFVYAIFSQSFRARLRQILTCQICH